MSTVSRFTRLIITVFIAVLLTASASFQWDGTVAPKSNLLAANVPTTVFPTGAVPIKRIVYIWTEVPGATQYQLQIYQNTTRILNTALNATVCVSGTCSYRHDIDLGNSAYTWRVRATIGGVIQAFSQWQAFTVSVPIPTTGFYSPFTLDATGWVVQSGAWNLEASNYLTTVGVAGKNPGYTATISHLTDYSTLTYEVRMRRDGCAGNANALIIRGNPVLDSGGWWNTEYTFDYTNTGYFSVWRDSYGTYTPLSGGTAGWVYSDKISPTGWNTLKVKANGGNLYFYINDYLVWSGVDAAYASGRVGIAMYRGNGCSGDKLWVDWAKLDTTVADLPSADLNMEAADGVPGGTHNTAP
jgi:hypothetical protein